MSWEKPRIPLFQNSVLVQQSNYRTLLMSKRKKLLSLCKGLSLFIYIINTTLSNITLSGICYEIVSTMLILFTHFIVHLLFLYFNFLKCLHSLMTMLNEWGSIWFGYKFDLKEPEVQTHLNSCLKFLNLETTSNISLSSYSIPDKLWLCPYLHLTVVCINTHGNFLLPFTSPWCCFHFVPSLWVQQA